MPPRTSPARPAPTPAAGAQVTGDLPPTVAQPELLSVSDPSPAYPAELPQLMTSAEVAQALRLSAYQVREYVRTGVLPAFRVGRELRFDRVDVARHINSLRITR